MRKLLLCIAVVSGYRTKITVTNNCATITVYYRGGWLPYKVFRGCQLPSTNYCAIIFSPPLRSDRGRLSRLLFFPLFLFFYLFFGCSDGMEREACVCDHGLERSDLCAETIIIIIIITVVAVYRGKRYRDEKSLPRKALKCSRSSISK